jgi:hypothetical protein
MKVAIKMRHIDSEQSTDTNRTVHGDCFAEFELHEDDEEQSDVSSEEDDADTVQVTVVLRGKRAELENPALGVTELVLRTLKQRSQKQHAGKEVIDAMGVAVAI